MDKYTLKFLLIGAPKTGKSTLLEKLIGFKRYDSMIKMEQYHLYLNNKLVTGIIQDLQDIDLMQPIVIPFIKDSGVIFISYNPDDDNSIIFIENWLKEYFKYIPASSQIYIISIKKNILDQKVSTLRQTYFCCKHISVDLDDDKDVEKLFERAGKNILFYARNHNTASFPGFKRKESRRSYCLWW